MTVPAMIKAFESLTPDKIRELGVQAVHQAEDEVVSDAIVANIEGLTFSGTQISSRKPFGDWEDSGEFHENLKFRDKSDIEFTSQGDGFLAIAETFEFEETIAPTATILDPSTMENIKQNFIEKINELL